MKKFVHDERDFAALVRTVASANGITPALVEKDYWVTHALWSIHQLGLEVWFKGGTSLSKGFAIIQRFSEDLDLRIEAGSAKGLPRVPSWTSRNQGPIAKRRAFFGALGKVLVVAGAKVAVAHASIDKQARNVEIRVEYPGSFLEQLGPVRPFVLLEVGAARVTPFVGCPLSSFVHDWLRTAGQLEEFRDNRPAGVRCVHPVVTLLEKLDAISRRFARVPMAPASFVRHYEDAAAIIVKRGLPPLEGMSVQELAEEMLGQKQIVATPRSEDPAFNPSLSKGHEGVRHAHAALSPMYWGPRRSLESACSLIRGWIERQVAREARSQ